MGYPRQGLEGNKLTFLNPRLRAIGTVAFYEVCTTIFLVLQVCLGDSSRPLLDCQRENNVLTFAAEAQNLLSASESSLRRANE